MGAINSLIYQNASVNSYEVIVVDNDLRENEEIKKIVKELGKKISIYYILEKKIGLSYARNKGGKRALSDYICYLDDDAKANPKYIKTLIEVIDEYKPDICGGPYYPFYLDTKPKWYLDRYGSSSLGKKARFLRPSEYLSGGNIVFRKDLLKSLEWFDPNLGVKGHKLWYGEETLMMINAWKTRPDLKVFYAPTLYVHHLVPAWKMSVWNCFRIEFRKGQSHAYFWTDPSDYRSVRRKAPLYFLIHLFNIMALSFEMTTFRNRSKYPFWQNFAIERISKHFGAIGEFQQRMKDDIFK